MTDWAYVYDEPCAWCAVWIGPHKHLVRTDGTLGLTVVSIEPNGDS